MMNVTYLVNSECNQNCLFCFNHWSRRKKAYALSYEQKLQILTKILALHPEHIAFSGGEPLLELHLVDLVGYVRNSLALNQNVSLSIQTNATLLAPATAAMLKNKVSYLLVSLHGNEREHDALAGGKFYHKAVNGIRTAIAAGIPVVINTVVTKKNVFSLPMFLRNIAMLGISGVQLSAVYPAGSALHNNILPSYDEQKQFVEKLNSMVFPYPMNFHAFEKSLFWGTRYATDTCGAGDKEIAILPNGDITLCPPWEETYGNILQEDTETVMRNVKLEAMKYKKSKSFCNECGGCLLRYHHTTSTSSVRQ